MLKDYVLENHKEELIRILKDSDEDKYYPIYIDYITLFEAHPEIADEILQKPKILLPLCDESAIEAQKEIATPEQTVKKKVRIRINNVPDSIDDSEPGALVFVTGIVVRISQPTLSIVAKNLLCKKCGYITKIMFEWERDKFPEVKECKGCQKKTLHGDKSLISKEIIDYQDLKIQDKCQIDATNSMSVAFHVVLTEDLVDKCTTGDQVNISGYVIRKLGPIFEGQRLLAPTFLFANSFEVRRKSIESTYSRDDLCNLFGSYWEQYKEKPLDGRDNILASLCPQLYGMYYLKLSLAVVLAGGVAKTNQSGIRIRGDSHLLLCGDPGTGKSQILRTAARLSSRSILTTGVGTTAAGLTAAAVKDSDGWNLEAGALVLAHGGVACIDELTTMSSHDVASIHEALEQQTISLAKAGLLSTLNCRCTVIAAINPKGGRFVDGEEVKLRLGGPLLSRFDLILYLKDNRDPDWDELVANHIMQSAMKADDTTSQLSGKNYTSNFGNESAVNVSLVDMHSKSDIEESGFLKTEGLWNEKTLREYFTHVRSVKPIFTENAQRILKATYKFHRYRPVRLDDRTTVRMMDSLVRLAEGHARLMYRSTVEIIDAIYASHLVNLTNGVGEPHCIFPVDPCDFYKLEGEKLLISLGLEDMVHLLL